MVSDYLVLLFYGIVKITFGAVGNIYSVGLNYGSQKLYSFAVMLKIDFLRMKDEL